MHELLANHMVRWQEQKMRRPEWQHRVALAARPVFAAGALGPGGPRRRV
jgi:hypothetical protein